MSELQLFAGWQRVTPDTYLVAFPCIEDADGKPIVIRDHTDRIPYRFEGTLAELEESVAEWDFVCETMGSTLVKLAVFPAGAKDIDRAIVPVQGTARIRELAEFGRFERHCHILDL